MRCLCTAAALLCISGCGRVGFDNGGGDGGAVVDFGPTAPASLTLLSGRGPVQAQAVIFHNPDGSVIGLQLTDGQGQATMDVPADAMITVSDNLNHFFEGTYRSLTTIMGVQHGDAIVLGTEIDPWSTVGQAQVSFTEEYLGAVSYDIEAGCTSSSISDWTNTATISWTQACATPGAKPSLIAYALDVDDNVLATSRVSDIALAVGGSTDVLMPAWQTPANDSLVVQVNNPPADSLYTTVRLNALSAGIAFNQGSSSANQSDSYATTYDIPIGMANSYQYRLDLFVDRPASDSDPEVSIVERIASAPNPLYIDVAGRMLPVIETVERDSTIPSRPVVTIGAADDLSSADMGMTVLEWEDEQLDRYEWIVVHPPGATSIEFPQLPEYLSNFSPTSTSISDPVRVGVFDFDFIADWDEARTTGRGLQVFLDEFFAAPGDAWSVLVTAGPGGFL